MPYKKSLHFLVPLWFLQSNCIPCLPSVLILQRFLVVSFQFLWYSFNLFLLPSVSAILSIHVVPSISSDHSLCPLVFHKFLSLSICLYPLVFHKFWLFSLSHVFHQFWSFSLAPGFPSVLIILFVPFAFRQFWSFSLAPGLCPLSSISSDHSLYPMSSITSDHSL